MRYVGAMLPVLCSHKTWPGHTKDFSAFWPRRAEIYLVSMTSAEDVRFSALRFHPASKWMNSAAEEFPLRFMACDVMFKNFKRNYYNLKVRKHLPV